MADFRSIMSLVFKGHSYRQIVEAVGCSHRDVSAVRQVIADRGYHHAVSGWDVGCGVGGLVP